MSYIGNLLNGSTIDYTFTTIDSSGVPAQLAGTPAVKVYKNNSTAGSTVGVTLSVDFDAITGLNHVRILSTAETTFYAIGNEYRAIISAGTVGAKSVVGYKLFDFSIENRKVDVIKWNGTTVTGVGNVAQTGDAYSIVNNSSHGNANMYAVTTAIKAETSAIHAETTLIHGETTLIHVETSAIHAETTALSVLTSSIHTETSALSVLTSAIKTETSAIHAETSALSVLTSAIKTETSAIHSETTNINAVITNSSHGNAGLHSILTNSSHGNAGLLTAINTRSTLTIAEVWNASTRSLTDKAGFSLSTAGVAAIHDEVIEGTLTARQIQRISLSGLAGESSGGGTTQIKFKAVSTAVNRITANVDANGNRTLISLIGT